MSFKRDTNKELTDVKKKGKREQLIDQIDPTTDRYEAALKASRDENKRKTIIRRIYFNGRWIVLDTIQTSFKYTEDSLYYDHIKDTPQWKELKFD